MSVGRNEPCPCGSGRKYKQCCLPEVSGSGPAGPGLATPGPVRSGSAGRGDGLYERVRRCEGTVVDRLTRFARAAYGETALADAVEDSFSTSASPTRIRIPSSSFPGSSSTGPPRSAPPLQWRRRPQR